MVEMQVSNDRHAMATIGNDAVVAVADLGGLRGCSLPTCHLRKCKMCCYKNVLILAILSIMYLCTFQCITD